MNNRIAIVALMTAAVASVAAADTVDMRFTGSAKGRVVRITHPGGAANVFSGQLVHSVINPVGPQATAIAGEQVTFCTDITQYITRDYQQFTLTDAANVPGASPMGIDRAEALHDLYNYAGWDIMSNIATNDAAAAFQLAVWEIVNDYNPISGLSSINLTSGLFRASKTDGNALGSGIMYQFNTFIAAIGSEGGSSIGLIGLANPGSQDQLVAVTIPAPGPAALAGLGALCLSARRRRTA